MSSSSASLRSSSPEHSSSPPQKRKRREAEKAAKDDSDDSGVESGAEEDPEITVLSHAEKRRQKRKEKLEREAAKEGAAVKKRKLKDGTSVTVPAASGKRQNSVWVGNMSFKTTQDDLRAFFDGIGEITRVNMPTKRPAGPGVKPENQGYAYVDFATQEAKVKAIALSEKPLLGRKLLIKDGNNFEGRPGVVAVGGECMMLDASVNTHSKTAQKILRNQKQPPAPTLFFGNLGFDTTVETLRALLDAHRVIPKSKGKAKSEEGEEEELKPKDQWIRKIRMGTFEDSGNCKGFAFIDFTSIENATGVLINLKNHFMNGRNLVVEYASPDAVRRGAPREKRPEGAPRGDRPFSAGQRREPRQPRDSSFRDRAAAVDQPPADTPADAEEDQSAKPKWGKGEGRRKEYTDGPKDGARQKGPRSRPKPGAALALAKRESAAIIPSQGQKIVF